MNVLLAALARILVPLVQFLWAITAFTLSTKNALIAAHVQMLALLRLSARVMESMLSILTSALIAALAQTLALWTLPRLSNYILHTGLLYKQPLSYLPSTEDL